MALTKPNVTIDEKKKTKILLIRPDRIGDVVLSTPVIAAIKHYYPNAEVYFLVRDHVLPVVKHNALLSGILVYYPYTTHKGFSGFWKLLKEIRKHKFQIAITLQVSFFVSMAMFYSGIRYRIGPYSKWYSFFIFNRGIRQARSTVEMHEADYNLMLLRRIGIRVPSRQFQPNITVDAEAKQRMREFLKKEGLEESTPFVVVHPGMGGSALNWPEGYYVDLIQRILTRSIPVLVTGSVTEKIMVDRVVLASKSHDPKNLLHFFLGALSHTGLEDFIALLSLTKVVIAPSTGALHIGLALGKPTVSFFSPIKVQSALRWGPYTEEDEKNSVLVPDALCGQDYKCAGRRCHFYFCMERLSVEEAFQNVLGQLGTNREKIFV